MKRMRRVLIAIIGFGLLFSLADGEAAAANDFQFVTTAELKQKMDNGEDFLLINALSPIEFRELTITGSVNIPSSKMKAGHPLLPADRDKLLIFYCKGPKCNKSRVGAEKAQKLGYTNILVYNEGLPAWVKAGYPITQEVDYPRLRLERLSPRDLQAQLGSVTILDIRGPKHLAMGKIKDAVVIPMDDLEEEYQSFPRGKKVILVDHAGKQVLICGKFLHMQGYTDLATLDGGMLGWLRDDLPVVEK